MKKEKKEKKYTEKIITSSLQTIIGERFGNYSKYIIQERALPDVRDGLKPVQRRILFSMHASGNTFEKGYRKSAKTVGNVIGNYHPHGDTSVYDAMVRLSQPWKLNMPLIDMHGNNGSIDGDSAAAMRYTEARSAVISKYLLSDLDKDTVNFVPNFDDTMKEPTVLPARYPNLLVNGASGIASGYATNIPPHNLSEVLKAVIYMTKQEDITKCTLASVMKYIKAPDFPTGGIIQGAQHITELYTTGKGKVILRAKAWWEKSGKGKQQFIITEIPYEVTKSVLVRKLDELRIDKKLVGCLEVRDESGRDGLRIVLEFKEDINKEATEKFLYKNSDLQINYNANMIAISNGTPKQMSLLEILSSYLDFREDVVKKRSNFMLAKYKKRHHIVLGLIKAVSILDEIIACIRSSKNKKDAKQNICTQFGFTEEQSEAIVTMQLYHLTNTDILSLEEEEKQLLHEMKILEYILSDKTERMRVIREEFEEILEQFKEKRRSEVVSEVSDIRVDINELITHEECIVTVTKEGYIKRTSHRSFSASLLTDFSKKEEDIKVYQDVHRTDEYLLIFLKNGMYAYIQVLDIPDIKWKENGVHISKSINTLSGPQEVVSVIKYQSTTDESVFIAASNGLVKVTQLREFEVQRMTKSYTYMKLGENEYVTNVQKFSQHKSYDVFALSSTGYGLRYDVKLVSIVGPKAAGVKGIQLRNGEKLANARLFDVTEEKDIVALSDKGGLKRFDTSEFERSNRSNRGLLISGNYKGNPHQYVDFIFASAREVLGIINDQKEMQIKKVSELKKSDRTVKPIVAFKTAKQDRIYLKEEIKDVYLSTQHYDA